MSFLVALFLASTPPCDLTLSGRVVDASSGESLPKVKIVAGDHTIVSDDTGRYRIEGLCTGPIVVSASRPDYVPRPWSVDPSATRTLDLLLEPRQVTKVDDVIVEAPRVLSTQTRAVASIEGDALDRARGKHLADAVADIPGVSVLRSGATAKPIVRGLSGARVLVIFDGIRHESQDWGLDHGTEIDPFAAGSIRLLKGAAGVRYGPDAIAGVLLIEPEELTTEPGIRADLNLIGASNGRRGTVAGRVEGATSFLPGLALRLEGNYSRGRALETPDYPLDNTGITEWNLGAKARYLHRALDLELGFAHLDVVSGLCSCISNESTADFESQLARERPIGVEQYRTAYAVVRPFQDVQHDRVFVRGGVDTGGVGRLGATYAFQINRRKEFDTARRSITGPQFNFLLRTHTVDTSLEHDPLVFASGATLDGIVGVSGIFQENVFRGLPLVPNHQTLGAGVFLVERLSFLDFEIEAGLRYDFTSRKAYLSDDAFQRHRARDTLNDEDCTLSGDVARCPTTFHATSVSLGLIAHATDWLTAKIDLSSATRSPTIDEQYINGTAPSFPVLAIGNPQLGTETIYTLSGTLGLETEWLSAEASIYGSYVDDYIYFAPELQEDGTPIVDILIRGAFPRFSYRAISALLYGAELGAKSGLGPFELEVRGALVRGQDLERDQPLVFIPPDQATAVLTYRPPDLALLVNSRLSLRVDAVARQSRFDPRADLSAPPSGYVLFGAGISTEMALSHPDPQRLRISIEASNLLNARYRDYTSLLRYFADEPGRQIILRIGTSFR